MSSTRLKPEQVPAMTTARSFSGSGALAAFDVSDSGNFPPGTIAFVYNQGMALLETWVLLAGPPSGSQLSANGQPGNHWQKA